MFNSVNDFVLLAIASALFGAVANILARVLLKGVKAQNMLGINFLTMGITLILFSPLFYKFHVTPLSMGLVALISLIDTAANLFYFKTFEKTEASVASPMLSLSPIFTFFFAWLILHESVSLITFALAVTIVGLVITFSTDPKNFKQFKAATLLPALTSSVLFGISSIPAKYLLSNLHVINSPTLYMFRAGFIALFSLVLFGFPVSDLSVKQYRVIFVRGLFVITQWLLLYYALSHGSAGVTTTLANITPIFVFILAAIFLKERVTIKKAVTASLILAISLII